MSGVVADGDVSDVVTDNCVSDVVANGNLSVVVANGGVSHVLFKGLADSGVIDVTIDNIVELVIHSELRRSKRVTYRPN